MDSKNRTLNGIRILLVSKRLHNACYHETCKVPKVKLIKKLISESLLKSVIFTNNTDAKTLINVKLLNVTAISTK